MALDRDIVMRVGWISIPGQKPEEDLPFEPLIEAVFPNNVEPRELLESVPRRMNLLTSGLRYRVKDATIPEEFPPFVERDQPIGFSEHETFQKLRRMWGWWFLRLSFTDAQGKIQHYSDFQVVNPGVVYPLSVPLEVGLAELVGGTYSDLRRNMLAAPSHVPDEERERGVNAFIATMKMAGLTMPLPFDQRMLKYEGQYVKLDREVFIGRRKGVLFPTRQTNHQFVVENYLTVLDCCARLAARDATVYPAAVGMSREDVVTTTKRAYALLREARIYELTAADYETALDLATQYVRGTIGWDEDMGRSEMQERINKVIPQVPLPDPLPFDTVYLGWGAGLEHPVMSVVSEEVNDALTSVLVVGMLLHRNGTVMEVAFDATNNDVVLRPVADEHGWLPGASVIPWVATLVIAALNDYRTIVNAHEKIPYSTRQKFHDKSKQAKRQYLPRPFYSVELKDMVIDDHAKKLPRLTVPIEWSHRWDVRGHEVLYVRRGPLPLPERKRREYAKEGFAVFEKPEEVTGDAYSILVRKGQPPLRAGEWLAVKKGWRAAYVKPAGRDDLPYIPSTHKPPKKLIAGGSK